MGKQEHRKKIIDEQDLASVGDVNQSPAGYYAMSISKTAQETDIPERNIREWFDRKLITPEGTRSIVRSGLETSEGLPNDVIRDLENTHLIRPEKRAGQIWYELAHDRLVEPVRSDNEKWFETHLNLFQHQAQLWVEKDRSEGLLLRANEFEMAEQQAKTINLTPNESDFLDACRLLHQREKRDQSQRRMIAIGFAVSLVLFFVAVFFSISAMSANRNFAVQANKAQAASTQAIAQQSTAQAASTKAIAQQSTAQVASTQAIAQRATAQSASFQALANSWSAATARANAETEKLKANEQEKIAQEQKKIARGNELAALSILAQNNNQDSLANLLAIEALHIVDNSRTRIQLLSLLNNRGGLFITNSGKTGIVPSLAFDEDNQTIISSNFYNCPEESKYYLCKEGVFKTWTLRNIAASDSRKLFEIFQDKTIQINDGMLDAITLSPDGKLMVSAFCNPFDNNIVRCEEEKLILWDVKTLTRIGNEIVIATNSYNSRNVLLTYSPDGNILAVGINDTTLLLLETQTYTEKGRFEARNGIAQIAFSPDSKTLAFASGYDNTLTFVDVDVLESRDVLIPSKTRAIISLKYSPDGSLLALGGNDGLILLWDMAKSAITAQMYDRQGRVLTMAFSPDGKILAAGHDVFFLTIWDVSSRQSLIRSIFRHTDAITSLVFSSDGETLASAGNEIILWDMSPQSWLTKACIIAGRNFTQDEWLQYFPGEDYRVTCSAWPAGK